VHADDVAQAFERALTRPATIGASLGVTRTTAVDIDVSARLGGALLPYLGLIVGLAFLLLMIVFRSIGSSPPPPSS
jgi:RND superfamily putative drug exporter